MDTLRSPGFTSMRYGALRPEVRRKREQGGRSVADELWSTQHGEHGNDAHNGERRRIAPHRLALDASRGVDSGAFLYGLLDDSPHERRGFGVAGTARFNGADERGLQRRLVFFEVQRHLLVGHPATHRPDQEPRHRCDERDGERHAPRDDRRWPEAGPLDAACRREQQQQSDTRHPHGAAHQPT